MSMTAANAKANKVRGITIPLEKIFFIFVSPFRTNIRYGCVAQDMPGENLYNI